MNYEYGKLSTTSLGDLEVKVYIGPDEHPDSPLDWDLFGTMVCAHKRYTLGHVQLGSSPDEYMDDLAVMFYDQGLPERIQGTLYRVRDWDRTWADAILAAGEARVERARRKQNAEWAILPLYLYDHGGISMRTDPFSCRWDSSVVGYIYATPEEIATEGWTVEQAREALKGTVATYSDYLEGNVHRYDVQVSRISTCPCCGQQIREAVCEDACSGYIGDVGDMLDDVADILRAFGVENVLCPGGIE